MAYQQSKLMTPKVVPSHPLKWKNGPVKLGKKNNNNFFGGKFFGDPFPGFTLISFAFSQVCLLTRTFPRTLSSRTYNEWCTTRHGYNQVVSVVFNDTMIPSWWVHDFNELARLCPPQPYLMKMLWNKKSQASMAKQVWQNLKGAIVIYTPIYLYYHDIMIWYMI